MGWQKITLDNLILEGSRNKRGQSWRLRARPISASRPEQPGCHWRAAGQPGVEVAGAHAAVLVDGFAAGAGAAGGRAGVGDGRQRCAGGGVVEGVATKRRQGRQKVAGAVCRHGPLLHAQAAEAFLHGGLTRQQAPEGPGVAAGVREALEQNHHAAAFGPDGFACGGVGV